MSDLLGSNRRVLVGENIIHPRGIAVDYEANAVFWVDSAKDTVETVEFNGNNRRIVLSLPNTNFFGIALYEVCFFIVLRISRIDDRFFMCQRFFMPSLFYVFSIGWKKNSHHVCFFSQ